MTFFPEKMKNLKIHYFLKNGPLFFGKMEGRKNTLAIRINLLTANGSEVLGMS